MKKAVCILFIFVILMSSCIVASAESNYEEYIYNTDGESVASPQTYKPTSIIYGNEQTSEAFSSPQDIATDSNGNVFILDSGNNRIVILDDSLKLKKVIKNPVIAGEDISFEGCTGLFIRENDLYIADKQNSKIYLLDLDGNGKKVIGFNPLAVVENSFIYKPVRITVDDAGIIQVQSEGCYNGLITIDNDGNMIGYYSANDIQASLSVIAAQFWRKIFSDEQQDSIKQIVPVEYSSITMDSEGFIYTTTSKTENSNFEIKKLNPYGDNILGYDDSDTAVKIGNGDYGDLRTYYTAGQDVDTTFSDIYVDSEKFIFALDTARGRVFQYDQNSNLISIFGGIGNQKGTFSQPCAVCGFDYKIYVLDSTKNSLTVFEPNEYVLNIRQAIDLDAKCDYKGASEYWNKVYNANSNYSLALSGLGKAAYKNGDLKLALKYFKQADDRTNYDIVYSAYRTKLLRENFMYIIFALIAIIVLPVITIKLLKRRKKKE